MMLDARVVVKATMASEPETAFDAWDGALRHATPSSDERFGEAGEGARVADRRIDP